MQENAIFCSHVWLFLGSGDTPLILQSLSVCVYLYISFLQCHYFNLIMYHLLSNVQVAQAAECARAAELRAQSVKHAALEQAARKDARAQCHKLVSVHLFKNSQLAPASQVSFT